MTVENARRHGHADPRFAARPRLRLIMGGEAIAEPRGPTREWPAFHERFFPDRRLHDFEAVKAYAAHRATGVRPVSAAIP